MRFTKARQIDRARRCGTSCPRASVPSCLRSGFTLIEVMIVIGIIVVMTAMAIPLFNFIMGNRSQDAAENLISAMLGRARNYAIANQRYAGVAFFLDPTSQRSTMALVIQRAPGSASTEDPYDNYKGWSRTTYPENPPPEDPQTEQVYEEGQQVIAARVVQDPDPVDSNRHRLIIQKFTVDSGQVARPNNVPPDLPWVPFGLGRYYDFIIDGDLQTLPVGVGCQLINDARLPRNPDRYIRTGVIFFDPEGRLASIPCSIAAPSELGQLLRLPGDFPQAASSGAIEFHSQMGLILYDQEEFSGQGFTEDDSVMAVYAPPPPPAYSGQEQQEEEWLDTNGLQLLVSRYTGTLLRGE